MQREATKHAQKKLNDFPPGLRPGPRWGSSRRSPRSPSRLGRGIPPPHSLPPSTPPAFRSSVPSAPRILFPPTFQIKVTPLNIKCFLHWNSFDLLQLQLQVYSTDMLLNLETDPKGNLPDI